MEIYIMRHGETVWNAKGIIQGRSNNRLSKNGKEQVKKQAEELKDIKFDYIFQLHIHSVVNLIYLSIYLLNSIVCN